MSLFLLPGNNSESGGRGSLQELETELDAEQKSLKEKKAEVTELNELMSMVRSSCFELQVYHILINSRVLTDTICLLDNITNNASLSGNCHPGYCKARLGKDEKREGKEGEAKIYM